jgi:hypothetical protein
MGIFSFLSFFVCFQMYLHLGDIYEFLSALVNENSAFAGSLKKRLSQQVVR